MPHIHSQNAGNDKNSEIVTTCPQGFVGVSAVFKHGQSEGLWKFVPLAKLKDLEIPAKLIILGAWYPGYDLLLDLLPAETAKVVWVTSSVAQMEMTPQEIQQTSLMAELLHHKKIKAIFYSGKGVQFSFPDQKEVKHAFYPLHTENSIDSERHIEAKLRHSIGLFLPSHFRKNISNQFLAFQSLIPKFYRLYTNIGLGQPIIDQKMEIAKSYQWLKEDAYLDLLSEMKVSLHCTWTESFSYGAAESIIVGTIPILSPSIAQNLELRPEIADEITVKNIDDYEQIAKKIEYVDTLHDQSYLALLKELQTDLKAYSKKAKFYLEETLELAKNS